MSAYYGLSRWLNGGETDHGDRATVMLGITPEKACIVSLYSESRLCSKPLNHRGHFPVYPDSIRTTVATPRGCTRDSVNLVSKFYFS